ncbi:MAG TPA: ATP-binding protein [Solirubrobacteraceae bacterium]|nr:ATP-binding protein [Solirubrobacteraceae bacterium]
MIRRATKPAIEGAFVYTRWHHQAERRADETDLYRGGVAVAIQRCNAAESVRAEGRWFPSGAAARTETHRSRPTPSAGANEFTEERRRWERDLHDGVQSELVSLLVRLRLAEDDPTTPPKLAETFATLADHAVAALDSLREITYGIYPRALARLGVRETLQARAARAAVDVALEGTAPRSTEEAEEAVYFACSEAIQNAVKHAGDDARVTVRFDHRCGSLAVRVADDGRGFDPAQTGEGAGLKNIRDRVQGLDGSFEVNAKLGRGTVLVIAVPWPPPVDRRR